MSLYKGFDDKDLLLSKELNFGDWILIQVYKQSHDNSEENIPEVLKPLNDSVGLSQIYEISKPQLFIFSNWFPCDQTIGFDLLPYIHDNKVDHSTQNEVMSHIEWDDVATCLGNWSNRPSSLELIKSYRKLKKEKYFVYLKNGDCQYV